MKHPVALTARVLSLALVLAAPASFAQPAAKKKVSSQADLPRHSYPVEGLASALVKADDATFAAIAPRGERA